MRIPMVTRLFKWLLIPSLMVSAHALATSECERLNARFLVTYQHQFSVAVPREVFTCDDAKPEKAYVIAQAIDDLHEADAKHHFYETARRLVHRTVIAAADSDDCTEGVGATMGSRNVLRLCGAFFTQPRLRRAALIFHEAAHGREKDPGHVVCSQGDSKGKKICDAGLSETYEGSGYNWEAHFSRFLLQNSSDQITRNEARAHLSFLLDHRINGLDEVAKNAWLK